MIREQWVKETTAHPCNFLSPLYTRYILLEKRFLKSVSTVNTTQKSVGHKLFPEWVFIEAIPGILLLHWLGDKGQRLTCHSGGRVCQSGSHQGHILTRDPRWLVRLPTTDDTLLGYQRPFRVWKASLLNTTQTTEDTYIVGDLSRHRDNVRD